MHFDSRILSPSSSNGGISWMLGTGSTSSMITGYSVFQETPDSADSDPNTDSILELNWFDFNSNFPAGTLPAHVATLAFETKPDPITGEPRPTTLHFTASEPAIGYDFVNTSTALTPQSFNLDVDGDGRVTAFGDGLMLIRKLLGNSFSGDALTNKAISPNATRSTAEIHDFIQQGIDAGLMDFDLDNRTTAFGDGLMLIRSMLGSSFQGNALIDKAISPNSPFYNQSDAHLSVLNNINQFMI